MLPKSTKFVDARNEIIRLGLGNELSRADARDMEFIEYYTMSAKKMME